MKRILGILVMLLFIPVPASAAVYDTANYESDGVLVYVDIEANTPWTSPFTGNANLSISVVPQIENSIEINITSVSLIVNRMEVDESGFSLISAEVISDSILATGTTYANYSHTFSLSGTSGGLQCYFAVLVNGVYSNVTDHHFFQALSPENLVGPFPIATGIASPTAYVGLIVIGISGLIFAAGVYGVKKSRTRSKRKRLLDE